MTSILETWFYSAIINNTKVFATKDTITIRKKISDTLNIFPEQEFFQVHKSFVIARKHIKSIKGNKIYIGSHIIPIGKSYKVNTNGFFKTNIEVIII
ncbi:LytTR family transcriptional regulator DNA-binding domain-containing protein [uncultured Croceitalea sp.]|uniref:LytTR family transcriptional regulator DNA-binding domain-containing protein n=1 Tax=uncultured Croceitalea sp. TaxID=1798908 RepID=UPI00374F42E1